MPSEHFKAKQQKEVVDTYEMYPARCVQQIDDVHTKHIISLCVQFFPSSSSACHEGNVCIVRNQNDKKNLTSSNLCKTSNTKYIAKQRLGMSTE